MQLSASLFHARIDRISIGAEAVCLSANRRPGPEVASRATDEALVSAAELHPANYIKDL
jgi:hypothetical protein